MRLSPNTSIRTVHPRVCGEHLSSATYAFLPSGSSPRLRGTRSDRAHTGGFVRFIPASAGNTGRADYVLGGRAVHPRVCGEHMESGCSMAGQSGSSPRLRGTLPPPECCGASSRFIPASAGNTCWVRWVPGRRTVHPRVCGEHDFMSYFPGYPHGSSPRLRGTLSAPCIGVGL